MKNYLTTLVLIIVILSFVDGRKDNDQIFVRLYALEGKWIMKTKKGAIGEEWSKINKDHLQNHGYMIRGKDTIITERVALKNIKEGIFYTSTVEDQNNQQPVSFRLTSAVNNIFIFENPQHDYPKRITYQLISNDSLHAWIDDGRQVPEKKSVFHYSRQNL